MALLVELLELRTNPSIAAVSIDTTGVYGTMVPSDDWIEVNTTFDGSSLGLSNIESDAINPRIGTFNYSSKDRHRILLTRVLSGLYRLKAEISGVCTQSGG